MTDTLAHSRKNLDAIATTLRKNRESTYTEEISVLHKDFDYAAHAREPWQVESLSLMAGSPLYEGATATQRLGLNHLWWVAFYQQVKNAEIHTILYNQLCAHAFFPLQGFDPLCHELDLESSQERYHIDAFQHISQETERALLGFPLFAPPSAPAGELPSAGSGWLLKRIGSTALGSVVVSRVSSSPFMASQYFLMRGFFNFIAKHKERLAFQLHRDRVQRGEQVPVPLAIIHYHYLDEAFHMATSQLISHEVYKDLPKPTRMETLVMNGMIRVLLKRVFTHYGSLVAGALGNDGIALPQLYRILRSKLFGLSHRDALHMLETSFCQEHQGFHASARLMEQFQAAAQRSMADIDYLWKSNREMIGMKDLHLEDMLQKNRRTFRRFARRQQDLHPEEQVLLS